MFLQKGYNLLIGDFSEPLDFLSAINLIPAQGTRGLFEKYLEVMKTVSPISLRNIIAHLEARQDSLGFHTTNMIGYSSLLFAVLPLAISYFKPNIDLLWLLVIFACFFILLLIFTNRSIGKTLYKYKLCQRAAEIALSNSSQSIDSTDN